MSIIFPVEYSLELGYDLECKATGLVGNITCEVNNARVLDISGFEDY